MANRFIGLQYPLRKTPRGILAQRTSVDQIKADLLQLLLTNPGERVMLPTFGTPLRELIFEPNDTNLERRAREMIANAILTWEPRIVISDITVSSNVDRDYLNEFDDLSQREAILFISIKFYDPENIQTIEELVLERPLGG